MEDDPQSNVERRLIAAIQKESLAEVASAIAAENTTRSAYESQLITAASQVCVTIRQSVITEARAVVSVLRDKSIHSNFDELDLATPQYYRFTVTLDTDDPSRAIELLERRGYWHPQSTRELHWQAYRRHNSQLLLTKLDDNSTQLDLHWRIHPNVPGWQPGIGTMLRHPGSTARAVWRRLVASLPGTARNNSGQAHFLGDLLSTPAGLLPQLFEFAGIRHDDVLLDIGCGDGRVLIEAARCTGCRAVGVERQGTLCVLARDAVALAQLQDRVTIHHADVTEISLHDATVVFLFIPVHQLPTVVPKLLGQLPPGTRVVAHEQMPVEDTLRPDISRPLIAADALTVAHLWRVT